MQGSGVYRGNNSEATILVAHDGEIHFNLVRRYFQRIGITNEICPFENGQKLLSFLFQSGRSTGGAYGKQFLLLLDMRMPYVDGLEALRCIRNDPELKNLPIIMLATVSDNDTIRECSELGCKHFLIKPIVFDDFVKAIADFHMFLRGVNDPARIKATAIGSKCNKGLYIT